ncbi:MAG TPA: NUDIX domain-containing protein [Isosphaeraceae bacterium]
MSPTAPDPPIRVGIGLIGRDGKYLIRRRPERPGSPMPGVWEFPGGKSEPEESPAAAALRECREETGLGIVLGPLRRVVTHRYAHGLIELHYFDCTQEDPDAEPDPITGFVWVPARTLPALTFPEANGPILEELARDAEESGR